MRQAAINGPSEARLVLMRSRTGSHTDLNAVTPDGSSKMNARVISVLAASYLVLTVSGLVFLFHFWSDHHWAIATSRTAIFALSCTLLHLAGFQLYSRQSNPASLAPAADTQAYRQPRSDFLPLVLTQQVPLLLLAALLLDGGQAFRIFGVAAIAHWSVIAMIQLRRRKFTRGDEFLIRWGFIPLAVFTGLIVPLVVS